MSDIKYSTLTQPYYGCSIGALNTVLAIPGAMPITHCGPGCNVKQGVLSIHNGNQGSGAGGGAAIPCSNITEKEVVFGGTERLHELIDASLKIIEADLFVVLTGCIPALVGDDVPSVVKEFQEKGQPIVYVETGGFKGNNFIGHELVEKAIIDQFVGDYEGEKIPHSVNVWTLMPYHNTFWKGDLTELKRLLEGIGLTVNILFGSESAGVSEWKKIPQAQFNLVVSPWLGLSVAQHLEKKYHQPFLHIPVIPIGAKETKRFLREVSDFAGLDHVKTKQFIQVEEKSYYYYLEHFSTFYAEYWWGLPSRFAVVGDSAYNLALSKFLVNQLGLIPAKLIITENTPEEFRQAIRDEYKHLATDVSAEIDFLEDGYLVSKILEETDFGQKTPIIFGTTWEQDVVKKIKGVILETSFPITYEVVLSKTFIGYRGALALLEKIFTAIIRVGI